MGHPRWQLDPNSYELKPYDATAGQMGLTDPMALALNGLRGPGGLILQPGQQFPQGIMLGGEGGNMLPIIPMLPGMFPLMLNPAGQLQGMEGGMQADQLQAALAAMQQASGGLVAGSTPMMLTLPSGQEGDANAMSASQALQFAQLQGLTGNGQLPTLLQLTVQPDGGLVQANGQQLQLPGLGMPLQLPGGLQILSGLPSGLQGLQGIQGLQLPEGVQFTTDANGNMQMMRVHDGSTGMPGADQAAVDAAVAAAAAAGGQADLPLMAGLTAMGANILDPSALAAAAAAAGEADPAVLAAAAHQAAADAAAHEQAGAAAAEAAAAQQAVVDASGVATSNAALQQALNMAAAAGGTVITAEMAEQYAQQMAAAAAAPAAVQAEVHALADCAAAGAAAAQDAAAQAAQPELPLPQLTADAGAATLPAIAPLNTSSAAIADALKAVAGGARAYNSAEEDAAAAALMSLATDKRKEAAQLLAQAQAATESGVIPEAAVNEMVAKAHRLQEEAEAEERAAAQAAEAEGRAHLEQQQAAQLEAQQQGLQQQLEALQQQQQLQQLQAAMAAQQQQQQEVKVEGADMGLQQAEQLEPKMEG
uniref:Uncharacterized protein n=1 Tax=Tetradesmus obliquus TaxID=3088 RepID=A0A383V325_TETOB|eukprot:jgi/Sobl393_1/7723/SZX59491.1